MPRRGARGAALLHIFYVHTAMPLSTAADGGWASAARCDPSSITGSCLPNTCMHAMFRRRCASLGPLSLKTTARGANTKIPHPWPMGRACRGLVDLYVYVCLKTDPQDPGNAMSMDHSYIRGERRDAAVGCSRLLGRTESKRTSRRPLTICRATSTSTTPHSTAGASW